MKKLKTPPGIIPALDVRLESARDIISVFNDGKDMISGYKIGSLLVMEHGFTKIENKIKTQIPIIFDMQKGATDIPEIVERQIRLAANYGVAAFIGSPLGAGSGKSEKKKGTLEAFVGACKDNNVIPIIVLEMTSPGALYFTRQGASEDLTRIVCDLEVPYVVAPANKPKRIKIYRNIFDELDSKVEIISPGVGPQKTGDPITDAVEAIKAGADHLVIGRAIYGSEKPLDVSMKIYEKIMDAYEERI